MFEERPNAMFISLVYDCYSMYHTLTYLLSYVSYYNILVCILLGYFTYKVYEE